METAHKTEQEKKEFFDEEEILELKARQLAEWIKESKHFTIFTGAGISTSCGVPDFRSGINTKLKTGPGAWEEQAQKDKVKHIKYKKTEMRKAIPSPTHMAIVELCKKGYCKFVISQNVDGLHRRSGIPPEILAELHGNTNLE
jgi:NAD-dependent SIR2 family protein deacetylase